jgi:hypothetical protein
MLVILRIMRLPADALAATVDTLAPGKLEYLLDGVHFRVIDWDGADRFCKAQSVGMTIDDHDLRGALEAAE